MITSNIWETKTFFSNATMRKSIPKIVVMEVSRCDIEEYIERVLTHKHKWIDTKGVRLTLDEINETDKIIRINDEFTRSLFFRLGKSLEPHTDMAKQHAASMKEAASTWQQNAIRLISDAVRNVQTDNKNNVKEIKGEAQRSVADLKKQLEILNKKHNELLTEHNSAQTALTVLEGASPRWARRYGEFCQNYGVDIGVRRAAQCQ